MREQPSRITHSPSKTGVNALVRSIRATAIQCAVVRDRGSSIEATLLALAR